MAQDLQIMDPEDAEQLAFDAACGFFNDDQLCRRYGLTIDQLKAVREQDGYLALVDENERLLKDDGSEFLIKAKGFASNALDTLDYLSRRAKSEAVRQKCAVSLLEYARIPTGREASAGGTGGPTIVINTNLGLNDMPTGMYTVEAKPPAPAVAERVDDNGDLL